MSVTTISSSNPMASVRRRSGWFATVLCASVVGGLVFSLTNFLNPDWFAYQMLFEQEGAWLAEQGRDILFRWLTAAAHSALGPDGYEDFRSIIAAAFLLFVILLSRGIILPFVRGAPAWPVLLLAVLLFGATRFTIQIREGIAMVVALASLRPIWQPTFKSLRPGWTMAGMLVAAGLHGGALMLPLVFFAAWVLSTGQRGVLAPNSSSEIVLSFFATCMGVIAGLVLATSGATADVIEAIAPGREAEDQATLAKLAFWSVVAVCCLCIASDARRGVADRFAPVVLKHFVQLLALLVLPAMIALLLTLVGKDSPAVLISAAARALSIPLALLMMVAALRCSLGLRGSLAAALLLADQVRVAVDAVVSTFGGLAQ